PTIPRLALLDAEGRPVVGNPELAAEGAVKPIVVDGGTVGWIARAPLRRLSSAAEVSFQQEQLRASWLTAALALALAAGLAVVLASHRGEVNALGKLVGDLNQLALADVGALAYRKQTVNVVPLVQQALESYRERFAERGLAIETALAGDARVFGDADRLVQLF